jgi:predicted nucleotidyltransferase
VVTSAVPPAKDLGEIVARIRARGADFSARGLSRIGVFGSFALGDQTPDSDVDLLVEFSDKPSGFAWRGGQADLAGDSHAFP